MATLARTDIQADLDRKICDRLKQDENRHLREWPQELLEVWYGTEVWQLLQRGQPVLTETVFGNFTVTLPVSRRVQT